MHNYKILGGNQNHATVWFYQSAFARYNLKHC